MIPRIESKLLISANKGHFSRGKVPKLDTPELERRTKLHLIDRYSTWATYPFERLSANFSPSRSFSAARTIVRGYTRVVIN